LTEDKEKRKKEGEEKGEKKIKGGEKKKEKVRLPKQKSWYDLVQ